MNIEIRHCIVLIILIPAVLTAVPIARAALKDELAKGIITTAFTALQNRMLSCRHCGVEGLDPELTEKLTILQTRWGRKLRFTSGLRCVAHNTAVGGVDRSAHTVGRAVDIAVPAPSQPQFVRLANGLGFKTIASPKRGYIHLALPD